MELPAGIGEKTNVHLKTQLAQSVHHLFPEGLVAS